MAFPVYLEVGSKRTFAGSLEWPGWSRSGKDAETALQALFDCGRRYGSAVASARLGFHAPAALSELVVKEELKGDSTTDFGAPGSIPAYDRDPVDEQALRRLLALIKASWRAFDQAAEAAQGRSLTSGPRGGGRDLQKIVDHVREAEKAYISRLGWKLEKPPASGSMESVREAARNALAASARGELPAQGPRGGAHWPARYFVRRAAWHVLDHAWEIEDRLA